VAGDAVVREEVGRVGENQVDAIFGDGGEDFEGVALKDFDVVDGVVKDGSGKRRRGGGVEGGGVRDLNGFAQRGKIPGLKPILI
jgi:hypothetical protein